VIGLRHDLSRIRRCGLGCVVGGAHLIFVYGLYPPTYSRAPPPLRWSRKEKPRPMPFYLVVVLLVLAIVVLLFAVYFLVRRWL
jgi:hypothetical protein